MLEVNRGSALLGDRAGRREGGVAVNIGSILVENKEASRVVSEQRGGLTSSGVRKHQVRLEHKKIEMVTKQNGREDLGPFQCMQSKWV